MPDVKPIIEAKEVNIAELLSNKFFEIPIYQRPFSWSEDNFQDFIEDISDALESGEISYFIGTILLRELEDGITYEIVDGQQRLTTMIILLAVFRDYLNDDRILQNWLVQGGDEYAGIPERERIYVWEDLQKIFRDYVYTFGGTKNLVNDIESGKLGRIDKDSPLYHLYEAIKTFTTFVSGMSKEDAKKFLNYLFKRVYVVRIITNNESSAFRLFNVLNTRGLPLTAADVLKSLNMSEIEKEKRKDYFNKWRDLEEDLGREKLEDLISYIRTIYAEEKAKKGLVDEFRELFKDKKVELEEGVKFFETVFEYGQIYAEKVINGNIVNTSGIRRARYQTLMDIMNRFLPFSDWVPPLLLFYKNFRDDEALYEFAFNLERKVFIEWCADFTATERFTSSANLIRLIKHSKKPEEVIENMFEFSGDIKWGRKRRKIDYYNKEKLKEIILSKIDDSQFYLLKGGKMARYALLRLDMELQEENFPGYTNLDTITVEHILPRSPKSEWLEIFSNEEIENIVNKLGNLTLLNRRRNSRASNYDFKTKKERYFDVKRSPFSITAMLNDCDKWDLKAFEKRHRTLKDLTLEIYIPEKLT